MEYKFIKFGFENCEIAILPAKYIVYLSINGIKTNINVYNNDSFLNFRSECESLEVGIDKKELESNKRDYESAKPVYSKNGLIERLIRRRDVVDITFLDMNKNEMVSVYVPWRSKEDLGPAVYMVGDAIVHLDHDFDDTNLNQVAKVEDDILHLTIKDPKFNK